MGYFTAFVYTVGSVVCHQIPERSFHLSGIQFPVCARCTGLYVGGAIGMVLWLASRERNLSSRTARIALLVAAVPSLVTFATAEVGWWDPINTVRATIAALLGVVAGVVVAAGLSRHLR